MVWCRPIARAASVSAPDPAASPAERSLSLPDSSGQHYAAVVALLNDAITVDPRGHAAENPGRSRGRYPPESLNLHGSQERRWWGVRPLAHRR